MTCGACGSDLVTGPFYAESLEPHGERHTDEYYECGACKARLDESDVYPDEPPAAEGREERTDASANAA